MAPTQRPRTTPRTAARTAPQPPSGPPELIDPRWILKALLATFAVAVACAYIVLCTVFYSRQWQLVLHPSHSVAATPAALHLPFQPVRFGAGADTGTAARAALLGWWIPGATPSEASGETPGEPTVLLLHGGTGSLSDTLPDVQKLHVAGLNVFAFDPRGFGESAGEHPTEASMEADSDAAYLWLTAQRGVPATQLIVFGEGLGASLAVRLCGKHPEIAATILEDGDGDTASRARTDPRSSLVPFRWLYREQFPLADPLHTLRTPKLILSYTRARQPMDAQRAADPKMTYEIDSPKNLAVVQQALRRFLDTYLRQPPSTLSPAP